GIPFLARATGLPIYPLTAFRQRDGAVGVSRGDRIGPEDYLGPRPLRHTMQAVVDSFSPLLIHFPTQWNNWTHLHRMICAERLFVNPSRELSSRYGVLKSADSYYLLQRNDFRAFEISEGLLT